MPVLIPHPAPGLGYGGAEYGYSPYGSGHMPREPIPVAGGYGGGVYGYGSYGSISTASARVSAAASIDGHHIEIFFSMAMKSSGAILSPLSYSITAVEGGVPVSATNVETGTRAGRGVTSVIVTTTGTTLGGSYIIEVMSTLLDVNDHRIVPSARSASFLALGDVPTVLVAAIAGDSLGLLFSEALLTEDEFSPGTGSVTSYEVETTYPVAMEVQAVEHPYQDDPSQVRLTVSGMTSTTYDLTVTPAEVVQYDGTILPSAATSFDGAEFGTGSSSAGSTGLLLTKYVEDQYGWDFLDTSGRLLPGSSFRVDVAVNVPGGVYDPPLADADLLRIIVSDGVVQAVLFLERSSGVDVVSVLSGSYTASAPASWSTAECTISLVRNQKANTYCVLFNGVPILSAPTSDYTGSALLSPGVRVVSLTNYTVTQLPILSVEVTSSQTVFSASWNFLHGVSYSFLGSNALTRPDILTARGPLVKDWGDPTPATKQDVAVRVNGISVEVQSVNPYKGTITPTIPIPLTDKGSVSVEVDYSWFPNPVFPMAGLNTDGLVLNKFDVPAGTNTPDIIPPTLGRGVVDTQRFPMGIVLGPVDSVAPLLVGHRYIGFERAYTAALNSPTTLLLNQDPHRTVRDTLSRTPEAETTSYVGTVAPASSDPVWALTGLDAGGVGTGAQKGSYVLVDDKAGSYGIGNVALYSRSVNLAFPSTTGMVVRVQGVEWEADGVYSGLCFGLHDNRHLYLVGLLSINDVSHIGLLTNPKRPDLLGSWTVGSAFLITITSSNTFTTSAEVFTQQALHDSGVVFQILSGTQAGVYTVASCGISLDGETATVQINESFPANYRRYGNQDATAYLQVAWDQVPQTLRLIAHPESATAQVFVGGALTGLSIDASGVPAYPAETTLLLPTSARGEVFWGSSSLAATNTSWWAFARYGITYDEVTYHFKGTVVAAEMDNTPDNDPNHEWFVTEDAGYGEIDETGHQLLLKSTQSSSGGVVDASFGYARVEPFLTSQTLVDVDATFQVESAILGAGDAQINIQNGDRSVLVSTILYAEDTSRRLVTLPSVSILPLRDPVNDGWSKTLTGACEVSSYEDVFTIVQDGAQGVLYESSLALNDDCGTGRIIEARLTLDGSGLGVGGGPYFGAGIGPGGRDVGLQFTMSGLRLVSNGMAVSSAITFVWDDGEPHTYRIIADPTSNTVVVVVDDTVLHSADLTSFTPLGASSRCYFGAQAGTSVVSTSNWQSFTVTPLPVPSVKRTIGVLRGGTTSPPTDIDAWELPRTDTTTAANSSLTAIVEEMDWSTQVQVRVRLDPGWGCTVFRPDLAPPPYYTGEFVTQFTEPSAGWINVEYRDLPRVDISSRYGRIAFGALDTRAITQQRWTSVRYRIYTRGDNDFIAPQNMVLNRANVITSGEYLKDTGAEVVTVEALTSTLISLVPANIIADRVFNVSVGDTVLNPDAWEFDQSAQTITLSSALSSAHEVVSVTFAPGKPITRTYLCSQPLEQSTTLLNEGTPPIPYSQIGTAVREIQYGSRVNDPNSSLNDPDFILNDPYRTVSFSNEADALYEGLDFCTVDNGGVTGQIAIACDGPAPGVGWSEIALSGTMFSDGWSRDAGVARWHGANIAMDSVGNFQQNSVLIVGGGKARGAGKLNQSILQPTRPVVAGPYGSALAVKNVQYRMRLTSVITDASDSTEEALSEAYNFVYTTSDNTPATIAGDNVASNPSGTPAASGNGAAVTSMRLSATSYTRLGPWAGIPALSARSLLGSGFILSGGARVEADGFPTTMTVEAP